MKKTLLSILACSAVLFGLISCGAAPDETTHEAKVVDLRNKKGGTVSNLRAATSAEENTTFSSEMINEYDHFIGENGPEKTISKWVFHKEKKLYEYNSEEFKKIKAAVVLSDDPNGVKFTINKPEGYTQDFTWINIHYLDDAGRKSTALDTGANGMDLSGKDKIELVFPLVDKTKPETKFWIQVCTDDYEAQLMYKVTPVNGYGCVDSVQSDFSMRDYLEITDEGVLVLKLTIPPVAKTDTLKHNIQFHIQTSSKPQYSKEAGAEENKIKDLYAIYEAASAAEVNAANEGKEVDFKLNLVDVLAGLSPAELAAFPAEASTYKYLWASFIYSYQVNVPGLENYIFTTPWVISNVVENPMAAE